MGPQFRPVTRSPDLTTTSNVVLKMNLFDRFARVAKSNLNDLAGKLEDPEKIMEQAIEEMQVSYVRQIYLSKITIAEGFFCTLLTKLYLSFLRFENLILFP